MANGQGPIIVVVAVVGLGLGYEKLRLGDSGKHWHLVVMEKIYRRMMINLKVRNRTLGGLKLGMGITPALML